MRCRYLLTGVVVLLAAGLAPGAEMPCATVSGGAVSGAGTLGIQNAGQNAIGRSAGTAVVLHAGLVPCILSAGVDLPGDLDGDGDVDLVDFGGFAECLFGPQVTPTPGEPLTATDCLETFDFNTDGDVDLHDFASFSLVFGQ